MDDLPATWEYEHTSWSEDDPLCAQLKRRADAMRDELLARIAELDTLGREGDTVSKQDAAEKQVAEKALAAVRAGRADVEWGGKSDVRIVASDGRWGPVKMPDGTVMQPGQSYPLDTGHRFYEVTIRWAE